MPRESVDGKSRRHVFVRRQRRYNRALVIDARPLRQAINHERAAAGNRGELRDIEPPNLAAARPVIPQKFLSGMSCRPAADTQESIVQLSRWYSWVDSNHRPLGPQPSALTN